MTTLTTQLPMVAAVLAIAKLGLLVAMVAWAFGTLLGRGSLTPSPARRKSTGARP